MTVPRALWAAVSRLLSGRRTRSSRRRVAALSAEAGPGCARCSEPGWPVPSAVVAGLDAVVPPPPAHPARVPMTIAPASASVPATAPWPRGYRSRTSLATLPLLPSALEVDLPDHRSGIARGDHAR